MAVCYKKMGMLNSVINVYFISRFTGTLQFPHMLSSRADTFSRFVEKRRILNDIYIVTATLAEIRETCPLDHIFLKITLRAWDEPHQIYQAIKFEHLDLVSAIPQTLKRALTVPSVKHHQPPRGEPTPLPISG